MKGRRDDRDHPVKTDGMMDEWMQKSNVSSFATNTKHEARPPKASPQSHDPRSLLT